MEIGRTQWDRWLAILPVLAFLATFGFFAIDKRSAAFSVLDSPRGLLTVGVMFVGSVVVAVGLKRFVRWTWVLTRIRLAVSST